MDSEILEFLSLTYNDTLKVADAIVCLEGDRYSRLDESIRLFKEKYAPLIVITGGFKNPPFSVVATEELKYLIKKGIPKQKILVAPNGQNTYEEAEDVMKMAKEKKWKKIILVTSHFHQPRAYLTILMAMKKQNIKIEIINAPVRNSSWFKKVFLGKNRMELLNGEFEKIKEYEKKGHLLSPREAIKYQQWKEK